MTDNFDHDAHQTNITGELPVYSRPLNLDRHFLTLQVRDMYLSDRGRRQRILVKVIKNLRRLLPEFLHENLLHKPEIEGTDAIHQIEQRIAIFQRQNVGLQGQHLAKLDERASQIFQEHSKAFGGGQIPVWQTLSEQAYSA